MTTRLLAVQGQGIVPADSPVVHADDLGFTRGDGCFDSALVVTDDSGARVVNLDEHLARLERSAAALEIGCPPRSEWRDLVAEALAAWRTPGEATMKLFLSRGREWFPQAGATALLTIVERPARPAVIDRELRVTLLTTGRPSDAFAQAPWLLGGVKTLSYATQVASVREAKRRGMDDAILTTTDGYALEGTTSGLLVVTDAVLRTPPTGATGILASTTVDDAVRHAASRGMRTAIELIAIEDLFTADAVMLISSSRGPCPVVEIDDRSLIPNADVVAALTESWSNPRQTC